MKRQLSPTLLGLLLLALLLGACVSSLPAAVPVPTSAPELPAIAPEDTPMFASTDETTVAIDAQEPISQTEEVVVATASPIPPPTPSPIPTPAPDVALEPTNALAAALDYLRGVYLEKLPASGSFNSVEVNQDISSDVAIVATFGRSPWQVSISDIQPQDNGANRTVIVVNEETGERWWGEVDGLGIVFHYSRDRIYNP